MESTFVNSNSGVVRSSCGVGRQSEIIQSKMTAFRQPLSECGEQEKASGLINDTPVTVRIDTDKCDYCEQSKQVYGEGPCRVCADTRVTAAFPAISPSHQEAIFLKKINQP